MYNYGSWILGSYLGVDGLDFDVVPPAKGKVKPMLSNGYGISSASRTQCSRVHQVCRRPRGQRSLP